MESWFTTTVTTTSSISSVALRRPASSSLSNVQESPKTSTSSIYNCFTPLQQRAQTLTRSQQFGYNCHNLPSNRRPDRESSGTHIGPRHSSVHPGV